MLFEVDVAWLSTAVTTAPETSRVPNTDSTTRRAGRLVIYPPKIIDSPTIDAALSTVANHDESRSGIFLTDMSHKQGFRYLVRT
jgi:hypothetical protein